MGFFQNSIAAFMSPFSQMYAPIHNCGRGTTSVPATREEHWVQDYPTSYASGGINLAGELRASASGIEFQKCRPLEGVLGCIER
jgi:hypothetical protein